MKTVWKNLINWWKNLHIPIPHLEFGWKSLDEYDNIAAKAAKKLGFKEIPTIKIKWYSQGGVFNRPQVIGVGESGKEAVVLLSKNSEWINTVSAEIAQGVQTSSNTEQKEKEDGKIALLCEQNALLRALLSKDTTIEMDGEKVTKTINKHNSNRGYDLGLSPA